MAKRQRPKIESKLTPAKSTQNKQEQLLNQLKDQEEKTSRFTMDIPTPLRARMLEKSRAHGQTLKGYILTLVRKDLAVE